MAKRASLTSKTNQAFKAVDARMTEAERTMRGTHEKVLETLQALFDRFEQWHARQEEILRRIEALEKQTIPEPEANDDPE